MYINNDVAYEIVKTCVKGTKNLYNDVLKGKIKVYLENGYLIIKIKLPKSESSTSKKKASRPH